MKLFGSSVRRKKRSPLEIRLDSVVIYGINCSRMDQVKFVEDSLKKI